MILEASHEQLDTQYLDGDMSHVQFVDGFMFMHLTEFGSLDATSGIWKIKTSGPSATYGTNGFFF